MNLLLTALVTSHLAMLNSLVILNEQYLGIIFVWLLLISFITYASNPLIIFYDLKATDAITSSIILCF
jgi:hypothetical protein